MPNLRLNLIQETSCFVSNFSAQIFLSAYTFEIGEISSEVKKLLEVTKECLNRALEVSVAGNRIGDIGNAVQEWAESNGYGVVRELVESLFNIDFVDILYE